VAKHGCDHKSVGRIDSGPCRWCPDHKLTRALGFRCLPFQLRMQVRRVDILTCYGGIMGLGSCGRPTILHLITGQSGFQKVQLIHPSILLQRFVPIVARLFKSNSQLSGWNVARANPVPGISQSSSCDETKQIRKFHRVT
jgi:hypothetical protein